MARKTQINVDITGDASKLKKAAKDAEKAIESVDDAAKSGAKGLAGSLGGAVTNLAEDKLGPLGDAIGALGGDLKSIPPAAAAAGAGVLALGGFVADGARKFSDMVDEVRGFKNAAGTTWEESSRLVAVMDDLGISADQGGSAMGRLAKNIDAGKLAEFGIEAVRANDGTVDMVATLGAVADRFRSVKDPTERAAMGTALFGKSWADLAPLLERGGDGIKDLTAGVKDYQIVNQKSADQQLDMKMAIDDMQDAVAGLQMSLARDFLPTITESATRAATMVDSVNKATQAVGGLANIIKGADFVLNMPIHLVEGFTDSLHKVGEEFGLVKKKAEEVAPPVDGLAGDMGAAGVAAARAAKQTDEWRNAQALAAAKVAEHAEQVAVLKARQKELEDQLRGVYDAQFAAVQAGLALERQEASQKASVEALSSSTDDYESALAAAKQESLNTASATVELARKQAEAQGATLGAKDANDLMVRKLAELRDAAGDPALRAYLDGVIGQLNQAEYAAGGAAAAIAEVARQAALAAGAAQMPGVGIITPADRLEGRASGGPVAAGTSYVVGERGPEVLTMGRQSGIITPNGELGGPTVNVTINGAVGDKDAIIRWVREGIRQAERAQR